MIANISDAAWIVIPLIPGRLDWIARLNDAASSAGYIIHDWDQSQDVSALAGRPLMVTASANTALSHQANPDRIAAITDGLDIAMPDDIDQAERHRVVHAATLGFVQLAALPLNRVFGANHFVSGKARLFDDLEVCRPNLPAATRPAMSTALKFYSEGQSVWPGEVLSWARPSSHENGFSSLDLTGRPRTIVFGPYFEMPKGRWKAVLTLSIDQDSSRYLFRADWGGMKDFTSQEFRPNRPGVFEIEMVYDWAEQGMCEFRLLVMEGVFHGRISMSALAVSRAD